LAELDDLSSRANIRQTDIDNAVQKITDNFTNGAKEIFGNIENRKKYYKQEKSKPWFNRKCALSRKKFHKTRKRYSFLKNAENRKQKQMRLASKEYKTVLNKTFADYQHKAANDLRNLSKKNPKELWKTLNRINGKKKNNTDDISLKTLYDHFKGLNENDIRENELESDLDFHDVSDDVEVFLNGPITEQEIKDAVSNLKNGKSSGSDEILNEYILKTH